MTQYEITYKNGQTKIFLDVASLLDTLADKPTIESIGICEISIKSNKDGTRQKWIYKSPSDKWYQETEEKIQKMSSTYREMIANQSREAQAHSHVWILWGIDLEMNFNALNELAYQLHITRDLNIDEYRVQFELLNIQKVISHQEILDMLAIPDTL